ncbi:hypothetical protein OGM63_13515 [Plectonema radiosum NIES-515]|uniref:Uncharacterized protein n=1 Tax=Plectonema radiosum NIES-515 TaxID=2986073 RepID=A0ABT3AZH9_9CYAN|nr:hypothetical protein [Plectonema radiosum]MCV3214518.1 hypothetical protein [Plectonema radiosum NIES-515]
MTTKTFNVHSPQAEAIYDYLEKGLHKIKFKGGIGIGFKPNTPAQFYIVFHDNTEQNLAILRENLNEFKVTQIVEKS